MLDSNKLSRILEEMPASYSDFRILGQEDVEIALRHDSFDIFESSSQGVVCRVLARGYGVAYTDRTDIDHVRQISELAFDQAGSFEQKLELHPANVEQGEVDYPQRMMLDKKEVCELLRDLRNRFRDSLADLYAGSELVVSHRDVESTLITSEGTVVREHSPNTDIILYLLAKGPVQGYASKILGGKGGFEVVLEQPWDWMIQELSKRAKDSSRATASRFDGARLKVILDSEGAGALAHELAHMLEADSYRSALFRDLKLVCDLEVVDDPTLADGYGSFHWDDEGLKGGIKTLLSENGVRLLHTRLTAKHGDTAGNARGVMRKPRPLMSNIYIKPSDWGEDEIFRETRSGVYAEGVIRADSDIADGRIELIPEIAHLIENRQITKPMRHFRIVGNIKDFGKVDAIGKKCCLRPNVEKSFPISEGGPYIRIDGITCY